MKIVMSGFTFATASARCCPQKFTRNPTCSESSPRSCDELERRPLEVDRLHAGCDEPFGDAIVRATRGRELLTDYQRGVAEGATPRNRSGRRTARAGQVWRAIRARCVCVSTEGAHCHRPCIYGPGSTMTGNLSGTRDRWGEPGHMPRSPFFVHLNRVPSR